MGSARSVEQSDGILPEAALCGAYASVDLGEQVGTVVDVPPEVYELVCLVEYGGRLRHLVRA